MYETLKTKIFLKTIYEKNRLILNLDIPLHMQLKWQLKN